MDDLKGKLLDGEEALWTGRPDRSLEDFRRVRFARELVALTVGIAVICISYFTFGAMAAVAIFLATAVVLFSGAIPLLPRDSSPFSDDTYVATNHRMIIKRKGEDFFVADWSRLQAYDVRKIGKVEDVVLSFDFGSPNYIRHTLYALPNADSLLKLIHKTS